MSSLSVHYPPVVSHTTSRISTQTQTQVLQIPLHLATPQFNTNFSANKLPSSLLESLPSNIFIDTPTTRDRVARYSNNSSDIFQSEVMFQKLKVTKLKKRSTERLRVEIKDIIKKELRISPYQTDMPHDKF